MSPEDDNEFERCPHDKENPYAQISRDLIRDQSISPECRWLIMYLLSMKDGWKVTVSQLINHVKGHMGRDKVYKVIKEAISSGYMKRKKISFNLEDKKLKNLRKYKYYVAESPIYREDVRLPDFQDTEIPDTENQDTKGITYSSSLHSEEKEEHKKVPTSSAASPIGDALNNFLLSKIKKIKPNFTKTITSKWSKEADKLLKSRTPEEIKNVINWVFEDPFWSGIVLSPGSLIKNLDTIELQMSKKTTRSISPITRKENDEKIITKIKNIFSWHKDICIGKDYVEFNFGPGNCRHMKLGENGFQEQVENCLRKMNLRIPDL